MISILLKSIHSFLRLARLNIQILLHINISIDFMSVTENSNMYDMWSNPRVVLYLARIYAKKTRDVNIFYVSITLLILINLGYILTFKF